MRTVDAGTSFVPALPVTRTVAARPLGVVATTARSAKSPGTSSASFCATSRSVSATLQSW